MKKVSHFTREPLKVIKKYTDEELDARWDDEGEFQPEAIRFIYCTISPDEMLEVCAIPGGSTKAGRFRGGQLKVSGVRAGVYDIMLLWRNRGVAFIELKADSYPSPAQKEFGEYLTTASHLGKVCRTLRDILEFLQRCNLKCRDTSHSP